MTTDPLTCPSCGGQTPPRYRACGHCGTPLTDRPAEEIRREVTIVTSDLKGSTALGERLDPESLREVMTTYIDEMRAVFEGHGGTIEKIIGDAIVAVFGLPRASEDDALRAIEAAAESQRALIALNDRLEQSWGVRLTVRTGVASGEVVVGEAGAAQHVLTGPTIAIATAMEQNAPANEVLVAQSTIDIVEHSVEAERLDDVVPKGSSLVIPSYRLVSVAEDALHATDGAQATDAHLCQTCGEENPTDFTYCGNCGASLAARQRVADTRKTVTIVFADPKPATLDGSAPSPEAMRDVMSAYFIGMQQALASHGATVEKFIGDAVMAVFGLPVRHEDDALRAVRAAADMQAALPDLNAAFERDHGMTLANHIGVNTGEVVAGDASLGQRLVTGDAVNVAARLEQSAGPREVLLGDLTYRLVRDAVTVEEVEPLTLKGKSEPVPAYRLVSVSDTAQGVQRRTDTLLVGRDAEMATLRQMFGRATSERACRLATVIGDAGVGKTRLVAEFIRERVDEALVIKGRCLPYGDGITFWPLREAVRDAAGIGPDDGLQVALDKLHARIPDGEVCDRLASVIGLSDQPFPVPEVFWGARKFLELLAVERPIVMVIDDIHWAEATFLDLLDNLVASVETASVMLLCTARHELLEKRDDWAGTETAVRLVLSPLSDADAGLVVQALLGGVKIDSVVQARIVQAAAGNPLFVEQLLSMLIDEGTLRREGDQWEQVGDLSRLQVPPSIEALLAARLDRLDGEERGVIEPASVIGQNFALAAVTALVTDPLVTAVPDQLGRLVAKQLVATNADDAAETAYRFQHLLVRDAAYGGLLKRARAEFHERFVDWAEEFNAAHGLDNREFEEIHGYHLEQAYRYLSELGSVDAHVAEVGERASLKLAAAGRRAFARGDMPAAVGLLSRAAGTLAPSSPAWLGLQPDLGEALMEQADFERAASVLAAARDDAREAGLDSLAAECELIGLLVEQYTAETDWSNRVMAAVERATPIFRAAENHHGLAMAARLQFGLHGTAFRWGAAAEVATQIVEQARAAGDVRIERRGAGAYAIAALFGPVLAPEAIAGVEEVVSHITDDRRTEGVIRTYLAQLYSMRGDFARARDEYGRARRMLEEVGAELWAAASSIDIARIEMRAGAAPRAEELLRTDLQALERLGETFVSMTLRGLLARAVYEQGRYEEADAIAHELELSADAEDVEAQVLWRMVRAKAAARGGDFARAEALGEEAQGLLVGDEAPGQKAEVLADRAEVARLAGSSAWQSLRDEAIGLYRAKGDDASAQRLAENV